MLVSKTGGLGLRPVSGLVPPFERLGVWLEGHPLQCPFDGPLDENQLPPHIDILQLRIAGDDARAAPNAIGAIVRRVYLVAKQ